MVKPRRRWCCATAEFEYVTDERDLRMSESFDAIINGTDPAGETAPCI